VTLQIMDFCLPAILDSGSSRSFIRREVFDTIQKLKLSCTLETIEERCLMANRESCVLSEVVMFN
jgi:hypothetical protein